MSQRRLLLAAILLGAFIVGPLVSCVIELPYACVSLSAVVGSVTVGLLLAQLQSLAFAGMLIGLVGGVVCSRVRCNPRPAALQTMKAILLLSTLLSLPGFLLSWRSLTWPTLLGTAISLALSGLVAALTGWLTALLAGWWEEQWQLPAPPELSTSRPRPTRYRL